MKQLKIDKAIYALDDKKKVYCFLKRNSDWRKLSAKENKKNKKILNGCQRVFRNGKIKIYAYNNKNKER